MLLLLLLPLLLLAAAPPARAADEVRGRTPATPIDLAGVEDPALKADLAAFGATDGATEFDWTLRPVPARPADEASISALTFPSPRPSAVPENNTVYCRYYLPKGRAPGARVPAAIVLHHLGGSFEIEAVLAGYLAKCGVAALEVEFPYYGPRRPKEGEDRRAALFQADFAAGVAATQQAIADVRRAADWLLARPEIDRDRLGIVGISLGGIAGSIAAGVDPRFKRNVLAIAGGDLPAIMLNESRETRKLREVFKERGITREDIARGLAPIEPTRFAGRIDAKGTLMLNANKDEVIPRASTEKLWEAARRPEIVWYDSGHASIAVYLMDVFARTRRQFEAPVSAPAPAAAPEASTGAKPAEVF